MGQKGFATILGLCLIFVAALIVAGISNAEMNHAYDASNFLAEQELQNAAYTGIHRAAKMVLADPNNPNILPKDPLNARAKKQKRLVNQTITSKHFGKITVETWGERMNIQDYTIDYGGATNYAKIVGDINETKEAYVFFSRAQVDAKNMHGNFYRRASAYILADDANKTIHYLELPMSSYEFEK